MTHSRRTANQAPVGGSKIGGTNRAKAVVDALVTGFENVDSQFIISVQGPLPPKMTENDLLWRDQRSG
jgi:hypothetical protein